MNDELLIDYLDTKLTQIDNHLVDIINRQNNNESEDNNNE